ncbi:TonB-dependent receptor [Winogradskyella sp. SYSU M77433]|uniref:TonB-dependent receptor n=1 Tax=Winogradskyella sp. SYSU M77433 TaxID=3042722 RepID=UPI0024811482|nr:TonB-dependent receptor [Winogradskyella sp. SYSU M77433]MDH7913168.1 TonB-dependent receptor [Winogradskyella sp. SYSU M77433]
MKLKFLIFIITISSSLSIVAQERTKDTIDDQVVNVIKPYTPTISDAFKIKDAPKLNDSSTVKKKEVKYNIFSIPVASTFTPAKGKAATVEKARKVKLYDNYASLGAGTYTTLIGEVYLNHELSSGESVGGYFSHHSSGGGIDGVQLDDDFLKTNLNAYYSQKLRDFSWKVNGGFEIQSYNWYGVPENFYTNEQIGMIDPGHTFTSFNLGGKLNFDDAIIDNGSLRFRRFGDNQGSGENRFVANAGFDIPIQGEIISADIFVDYVGGSFDNDFANSGEELKYGNVIFGLAPSYQLIQDDLTVDLGVKFVYSNDLEYSDSKFFIYPNIEASYRVVDEILIGYAGVKGGLQQNSYYDFANENPFVSPNLLITPTDQAYNGFIGLKGKLSNSISYNVRGNYYADNNKALFKANNTYELPEEDYLYGNSFGVVYDDLTTFSIAGELNVDVNRNFTLGVKGEYFSYNTDNQEEAWNLPDITGSVFLDYQISEQWFAGASAFFVGERKDQSLQVGPSIFPDLTPATLDSYFDVNAHVGYKINDQLSVFAKGNNLFNQDYQRYLNFPVQGIQILAGATYQFDF